MPMPCRHVIVQYIHQEMRGAQHTCCMVISLKRGSLPGRLLCLIFSDHHALFFSVLHFFRNNMPSIH